MTNLDDSNPICALDVSIAMAHVYVCITCIAYLYKVWCIMYTSIKSHVHYVGEGTTL